MCCPFRRDPQRTFNSCCPRCDGSGPCRFLRLFGLYLLPIDGRRRGLPSSRSQRTLAATKDTNRPLGLPGLVEAAGVKKIPRAWHGLRHSFASNFLLQAGSVLALQKILGHSKLETTMIYAHLSAEFVDGAIEKLRY